MKKLLLLGCVLATVLAIGQTVNPVPIGISAPASGVGGIVSVSKQIVNYGVYGGYKLKFQSGAVYVDTVPGGAVGKWKRIDNGADSCSNAFWIARDSGEVNGAVWHVRFEPLVTASKKDSATTAYKVQTRTFFYNSTTRRYVARPWTYAGTNAGTSTNPIEDSVIFSNIKLSNTKVAQYGFVNIFGTQARVCPEKLAGTAGVATDSTIHDSVLVFVK